MIWWTEFGTRGNLSSSEMRSSWNCFSGWWEDEKMRKGNRSRRGSAPFKYFRKSRWCQRVSTWCVTRGAMHVASSAGSRKIDCLKPLPYSSNHTEYRELDYYSLGYDGYLRLLIRLACQTASGASITSNNPTTHWLQLLAKIRGLEFM